MKLLLHGRAGDQRIKARTVSLSLTCAILLAAMTYGGCHYLVIADRVGEEAGMASNLGHLQVKLIDYYATKGRWPEQLGELKLSDFQLTDRVSRKPLLYFPDATHDTTDILVAQPEPFRMGLWPFGEMRRHVMLARSMDAHRILYGEDAIVLKKAGLHAPR